MDNSMKRRGERDLHGMLSRKKKDGKKRKGKREKKEKARDLSPFSPACLFHRFCPRCSLYPAQSMGTSNVGQLREGGASVGSPWEVWKRTQMVCGVKKGLESPAEVAHACHPSTWEAKEEDDEFRVILS